MRHQLITIRQIECFLTLTRTLNFSRAAQKLYMSQPTFSRQIHMLEENLGVKLFYYHGKKVQLSSAGTYLQVEFEYMLKELDMIAQNARKLDSQYAGTITMGVCGLEELPSLPAAMRRFRKAYPDMYIKIKVASSYQLLQDIQDGELDLICCMRSPAAHAPELQRRTLRRGRFFCLAPEEYPLAKKDVLAPADIAGYPWVFRNNKDCTPVILRMQQRLKELYPDNSIFYSSSPEESALMVRGGLGVTVVVSYSVSPNQEYRMIPFEIPMPDAGKELDLIALWNGSSAPAAVVDLVQMLCEMEGENM